MTLFLYYISHNIGHVLESHCITKQKSLTEVFGTIQCYYYLLRSSEVRWANLPHPPTKASECHKLKNNTEEFNI